jgi:DNA-binding CsgD family transcriptional regulator
VTAGLLGREREYAALEAVLQGVRTGRSSVLVVRGEAGIGKSALLDHLAARAADHRVERTAGVESEMELPYSGLHQLCAGMLDHLERVPGPQRDALLTALGHTAGEAPDRFLVGLAVLGLLADVATRRPLVCLIDDAQWLDHSSAQTLTFVARRLQAEAVALVFAVRDPSDALVRDGLPELQVSGLGDAHARALMDSVIPGPLDPRLRDRIAAEARGNPLALLEIPRALTPAQLAGGFGLTDRLPLTSRIERSFLWRYAALPVDAQRFVLLAAAESLGDVTLLLRAASALELDHAATAPAEAAGLIELGATARFPHPLMRSAVYGAASVTDRRLVHRALADATDPATDPDRRAWHRAHAADGADEAIAAELEHSAGRARARGGIAAGAAFLAAAAELTPDAGARAERSLAAAQAKLDAADPDAALRLLAIAEVGPIDALQGARTARLRAQIAFARRRGRDAPPLLLDAARRLGPLDAAAAREAYLEAIAAAMFAGRLGAGPDVHEAAQAARSAPPAPEPPRAVDHLLDGLTARFTDGYVDSVPAMRRALQAFAAHAGPADEDMRWLWLACRMAQELWDEELWHALSTRALEVTRAAGALSLLPIANTYRASLHVYEGDFDAARALIHGADVLVEAGHLAPLKVAALVVAAWRGDEAVALAMIEAGRREATERGEGMGLGVLGYSTALLFNGCGKHDQALAAAQEGCAHDDVAFSTWSLAELVEAAVRRGEADLARAALQRLAIHTRAAGTDWALGTEAAARALVAGDDATAQALHLEAIERLGRTRSTLNQARARLLYGEWLRAQDRPEPAREQLRLAHDAFADIGAKGFAQRARVELQAAGESVRDRDDDAAGALTAQEAQIARLARDGRTNPEIGALLFISPRTVEWHLRNVFVKLDISSRRDLQAALADPGNEAVRA